MTVCCNTHTHRQLHDVLASNFIYTPSQVLILAIRVLLPDFSVLLYLLDAQLFAQPQQHPHKEYTFFPPFT